MSTMSDYTVHCKPLDLSDNDDALIGALLDGLVAERRYTYACMPLAELDKAIENFSLRIRHITKLRLCDRYGQDIDAVEQALRMGAWLTAVDGIVQPKVAFSRACNVLRKQAPWYRRVDREAHRIKRGSKVGDPLPNGAPEWESLGVEELAELRLDPLPLDPMEYRMVVLALDGMDYGQIAQQLGVCRRTVDRMGHRIVAKAKKVAA